jgi:hypothetical protein
LSEEIRNQLARVPGLKVAARSSSFAFKGRHYFHKRTEPALRRAVQYFEEAIALDPGYALAHTGLSGAWTLLSAGYYGNLRFQPRSASGRFNPLPHCYWPQRRPQSPDALQCASTRGGTGHAVAGADVRVQPTCSLGR